MKVRKYAMLLFVIPLLVSGCLRNPLTGKLGPSWDLPLRIPLIHETVILGDTLETIDRDEHSGLFYFNFSETQSITIDELNLTISDITLTNLGYETIPVDSEVSISDHLPDFGYKQVDFAEGILKLEISDFGDLNIDTLSIGGEVLTQISSTGTLSTYKLDTVTIISGAEIMINGTISGSDTDMSNAEIKLSFAEVKLARVVGMIEKTPVDIGNHRLDMDMEWPKELDDVDIKLAGTSLNLKIKNHSGVDIDLASLEILAVTNHGDISLSVQDGFGVVQARETNTLILDDDNSNINEILNARPTRLELNGAVLAGNDQKSTTFDFSESQIDISFDLTVHSTFAIEPGGFVYTIDAQEINVPTDALDSLDDLTNDTIVFHATVKNALPIGASVELRLSTAENAWDDPAAEVFTFDVASGEVDSNGMVINPKETAIVLPVNNETRGILREGAYAEAQITIPNDSDESLFVSIREMDSISATAWVELVVKVNK